MVEEPVTGEFHPVVLSRTAIPRWRERWLRRPRLDQLLAVAGEVRLTVLVAPAGYGKTIALAGLAERGGWPVVWCRAAAEPAETLLAHLAQAFAALVPSAAEARSPSALANALARALEDETLLILDDAHLLSAAAARLVEELIAWLPEQVHFILAARRWPLPAAGASLLARGDAVRIGPADLAFTDEEARQLRALCRQQLTGGAALEAAEGWPIAVDLALRSSSREEAEALLAAYVEREIVAPLDEADRRALFALAAVDEPSALPAVSAVLGRALEETTLDSLGAPRTGPLLLPIVRQAVRDLARRERGWWQQCNRAVAERLGDNPAALGHWLLAEDAETARALFDRCAEAWLALDPAAVAGWFERLYGEDAPARAALAAARAHRAAGRIPRARALAKRACAAAADDAAMAVSALHLLASLALDTVEPNQARAALRAARRLLSRDDPRWAEHLDLVAQHWIDVGRPRQALRVLAAKRSLGAAPMEEAPPRLLLRTGRLAEARANVEREIEIGSPGGVPAAHREPALLLAYLDAAMGSGARALAMAQRGILEAQRAGHLLTEAVSWIRLGHAYQVAAPLDPAAAIRAYETAIAVARAAGIQRTEAEAYLGLLAAHGHAGELGDADGAFERATAIAARAGDRWLRAWALVARAAVAVANEAADSADALERAERAARQVEDAFGLAVVALWRAIFALQRGEEAQEPIEALLELVTRLGVRGLLAGPSLYGPRDTAALIPVLLKARATRYAALAEEIVRQAFPTVAADPTLTDYHPGYTLRVQLLGTFRVWRGRREVAPREWQREKAKQLFQLLVTWRGRWLQREQICSLLWPAVDPAAAEGQFKVALNALNAAIEPRRPARVPPFFIRRNGLAYAFAPTSGVWIDVDEFDVRVESAARGDDAFAKRALESALALYRGDYLVEALYDPWTIEERERLLARYLSAAVDFGARLLADGRLPEAVALGEAVLRRDRAYERAHQLLMRAHAAAGDREAAVRVYRRCLRALREELGADPLPETVALFERIRRGLPVSS
ncbi:MAG: BTAD domain-containing putative transcriptional regulator [Chloroflexota bacterium]|nr:transcriptional regulator [Dehalococcoidia bacterium]MDW8254077.1 BTAD domain-containing putative transcriptional regulator [Chloroflexota bacterium]